MEMKNAILGSSKSTPLVIKEGKKVPAQMSASIEIHLSKKGIQFGRDTSLFSVDSTGQVNQGDSADVVVDHKATESSTQNEWTLQHYSSE